MAEVQIPFLKRFKEPMLSRQKIMTSRTEELGEVGDHFEAWDTVWVIIGVVKLPFVFVANRLYALHGVKSPKEYCYVWEEAYPERRYIDTTLVHTHIFTHFWPLHDEDHTIEMKAKVVPIDWTPTSPYDGVRRT